MLATLLAFAGNRWAAGLLSPGGAAVLFGVLLVVVRPLLTSLAKAGDRALLAICVVPALLAACLSEVPGTGYLIGAFVAGAIIPASRRPLLLERLEIVTSTVVPIVFLRVHRPQGIDRTRLGQLPLRVGRGRGGDRYRQARWYHTSQAARRTARSSSI